MATPYGLRGWNGVVSLCGDLGDLPEHLRRRRLIEAGPEAHLADRLEEPRRSDGGHLGRVLRDVEGDLHVALRAEVVDLVRLHRPEDVVQRRRVVQIPVVEDEPAPRGVRVLVDVVDPLRC